MGKHSSRIDKIVRQVLVCLFVVVGILGVYYSYNSAISQSVYAKVKYGVAFPLAKKDSVRASQELYDLHDFANSKYSHNYYLHSYVARETIDLAKASVDGEASSVSFEEYSLLARKALFYAKQAIDVNPYDEESRLMYQEALVLNGKLDEAIEYWKKNVVDLEYWNRAHHDVMAELYLKSNNITLAVNELPHVSNPDLRIKLQKYKKLLDKRAKNDNLKK